MNLEFYVLIAADSIEEAHKNNLFLSYHYTFSMFNTSDFRNAYLIGGLQIAENFKDFAQEHYSVAIKLVKVEIKLNEVNTQTTFGRLAGPNNVG